VLQSFRDQFDSLGRADGGEGRGDLRPDSAQPIRTPPADGNRLSRDMAPDGPSWIARHLTPDTLFRHHPSIGDILSFKAKLRRTARVAFVTCSHPSCDRIKMNGQPPTREGAAAWAMPAQAGSPHASQPPPNAL
jgi:hypothetical protein